MAQDVMDGNWWLPDRLSEHCFGALKFGERWELELRPGFNDGDGDAALGLPAAELIHGVDSTGQPVSLVDNFMTSSTVQFGGYPKPEPQRWHVGGIFVGAHLSEPDESVKRVVFELSALREWSSTSPLTIDEADGATTISAVKDVLGASEIAGHTIEMYADCELTGSRNALSMRRRVRFRVGLAHERYMPIREVESTVINPLRSMVAFLTLTSAQLQSVQFTLAVADRNERERVGVHSRQMIDPPKEESNVRPGDMMCTWAMLGVSFDELMNRWFAVSDRFGYVITMLLVPQQGQVTYGETTMLTACLAAEALHGLLFDQLAEPKELHRQRSITILEGAPEQHREWLTARLSSNAKGLRRRFEELIGMAGSTGERVLDADPGFVARAVQARHVVAHPSSFRDDDGERFLYLSLGLRWIVRHCILLQLGYSEDEVTSLLTDCSPLIRDLRLIERLQGLA